MGFIGVHSRFTNLRKMLGLNVPVDPRTVSALSVLVSLGVIYNLSYTLVVVLLLDLLDGMISRGREMASRDGLLMDYACDRYSEFIIFGYLAVSNPILLTLPVLNTLITFKNIEDKRFIILPLRQLLLLVKLLGL
ncbi:MAG: CDP-alcohol phosphatidyltransferase family protein [Candidatus Altiarchaeota archaeon]